MDNSHNTIRSTNSNTTNTNSQPHNNNNSNVSSSVTLTDSGRIPPDNESHKISSSSSSSVSVSSSVSSSISPTASSSSLSSLPDISTLFSTLDMKSYLPTFVKEKITSNDLSALTNSDLQKLIPEIGPRRRLERSLNDRTLDDETKKEQKYFQHWSACVICHAHTRSLRFDPCGHFCCCDHCGAKLSDCPLCSTKISSCAKTFFS